jgi:hypothetical protein
VLPAGKPGSDAAHYHSQQQERIRVKQGKLGYYIGHHSHVQSAEAGEEVIIKPGERDRAAQALNCPVASCSRRMPDAEPGHQWEYSLWAVHGHC